MSRLISPPIEAVEKLRQPLTEGEKTVLEYFDSNLTPDWEIYIQPHMNGLRPDFVLLHERAGIVVVEVKDWNLSAMEYEVEETLDSNAPILYANRGGARFAYNRNNPFNQANLYREETLNLYCPSFEKSPNDAFRLVSSLVIFTQAARKEVVDVFHPVLQHYGIPRQSNSQQSFEPSVFAGSDDLESLHIVELHPHFGYMNKAGMGKDIAADLRHWLVEPDFSAMQRRPLPLDDKQRELVLTRNKELHRKIKGPAGCGKSLLLAARAAQLCMEQKEVLIITFNITLLNYLEDLAVRWPEPGRAPVRKYLQKLNFHSWCKRIALEAGADASYKLFWKQHFEAEEAAKNQDDAEAAKTLNRLLDEQMAQFMDEIIGRHSHKIERYDAILVDEGQDFNPAWWNCLRKLLVPGGEMLLVADESQDIYEKSGLWTEDSMKGCGLSPQWVRLDNSYRIPNALIPVLRDFADRFIPEQSLDLPNEQPELFPANLRWRQVTGTQMVSACFEEVVAMAGIKLPNIVPFADVTVAVANKMLAVTLIQKLETANIKVTHTFDLKADPDHGKPADNRQERRKKLHFYKGDARVKITTIHSLKGLESRSLILCLDRLNPALSGKLLYTGMTRLKRSDEGSHLTVVSSVPELIPHGRTWPDYQSDFFPIKAETTIS